MSLSYLHRGKRRHRKILQWHPASSGQVNLYPCGGAYARLLLHRCVGTWPRFQCQETANNSEKCGLAQGQEVHPQGSSNSPGPGGCQLHNWQKCPHRPRMGRGINNHVQEAIPAGSRAGLALTGRWRHLPPHQVLVLTQRGTQQPQGTSGFRSLHG